MRSSARTARAPESRAGCALKRFATVLFVVLSLAYPLAVYFGMRHHGIGALALLLFGMALLRLAFTRQLQWLAVAAGAALLALAAWASGDALPLKLYPALVNAVLLLVFGASLLRPPTVVERIARLREPDLSPRGVAYTRRVTQVWCGFFLLNGTLALATALWAPAHVWTLYNGLVAYLLIGLLAAGEWLVRRRVKAADAHG